MFKPTIIAEYNCSNGMITLHDNTTWTGSSWSLYQMYAYIKILVNGVTTPFYNTSGNLTSNVAFSSIFLIQGMQNVVLGFLPGYGNSNNITIEFYDPISVDRIKFTIDVLANCTSTECITESMCNSCCSDKPCKKCKDKKFLLLLGLIGYEALMKCNDKRAQKLIDKVGAICKLSKKCC